MKRIMLACGILCSAMIGSGCSTVSKSYGKDGRETLIIRCDDADSISACREQAKNECPHGFTPISETTGTNRKELRVICKTQVDKVAKGKSASAARPSN